MMKAWDARASYQMGTNMKAWTFMILRATSSIPKSGAPGSPQTQLDPWKSPSAPWWPPTIRIRPSRWTKLRLGLAMLPAEQREALILVGAGGFAYEEAAAICDCAVGHGQEPGKPRPDARAAGAA